MKFNIKHFLYRLLVMYADYIVFVFSSIFFIFLFFCHLKYSQPMPSLARVVSVGVLRYDAGIETPLCFEVEYIQELMKKIGKKYSITQIPLSDAHALIETSEIPFLIAPYINNFADELFVIPLLHCAEYPFYAVTNSLYSNPINNFDDLKNKKIGVISESIAYSFIKERGISNILCCDSVTEACKLLYTNKVSVLFLSVCHAPALSLYCSNKNFVCNSIIFENVKLVLYVAKFYENMLDLLERGIVALAQEDFFKNLKMKWQIR